MIKGASSTKVSGAIDRALRPILKAHGFSKFRGRSAYRYEGDTVFGFTTCAVGAYFASITGFTPSSFTATLWVNYQAIPARKQLSIGADGLVIPTAMHRSIALSCCLDSQGRTGISTEPERSRVDIWWVHPDGENLDLLARDLGAAIESQGFDWISVHRDKERVLALVDSEGDCFGKYEFMYWVAQSAGNAVYSRKYKEIYYRAMPKYVKEMMRERGYALPSL